MIPPSHGRLKLVREFEPKKDQPIAEREATQDGPTSTGVQRETAAGHLASGVMAPPESTENARKSCLPIYAYRLEYLDSPQAPEKLWEWAKEQGRLIFLYSRVRSHITGSWI